jgi:hypothetical protein
MEAESAVRLFYLFNPVNQCKKISKIELPIPSGVDT